MLNKKTVIIPNLVIVNWKTLFGLVLPKLRDGRENAEFASFAISADFASLAVPVSPDATAVVSTAF